MQKIFISYSSLDNEPEGKRKEGWVSGLLKPLRKRLGRKVGENSFEFFVDFGKSRGDEGLLAGSIPKQLQERLAESSVYLGVLSANYCTSKWCIEQELRLFEQLHGADNVVFLEFSPPPPEHEALLPAHFRSEVSLRCRFWSKKADNETYDETLGLRMWKGKQVDPATDPDLAEPLKLLVEALADRLNSAARKAATAEQETRVPVASATPIPVGATGAVAAMAEPVPAEAESESGQAAAVFVAESSPGMQKERRDLIRELVGNGFPVIDPMVFPRASDVLFCQQVEQALGRPDVIFAQVLDGAGGRVLQNNGAAVAVYQASVAAARRTPMVQWRTVRPEQGTTAEMQKLLEGKDVQSETFLEFVRAVGRLAADPPIQARVVVRRDQAVDAAADAEIDAVLRERNLSAFFGGLRPNARLGKELDACEALILVQGAVAKEAVESHFKECVAAIKTRVQRLPQIGLLRLPPPKGVAESAEVPAISIACDAGFNPVKLKAFLDLSIA